MKTFSRIFIYSIAAILLAWILPWGYKFITAKPITAPFTLYSSVVKSFAYIESDKNAETQYKDFKGNSYSIEQFDSVLPFFFYRQLMAKERLPETINDVEVTPASIRKSNFNIKQSTRDVNVNAPKVWMMMESLPSHVDLEDPEFAFRTSDKIEFINMKTNQIDENKSELFTKVMKEKGFQFPVKSLNGNPTTKKDYDEGYIMIDDNNKAFHVKMMKGRPFVKSINSSTNSEFVRAIITEFPSKEYLTFLSDNDNNLFIVDTQYNIHKLPFKYNPVKEDLMIIGNMLDWTVRVTGDNCYTLYAIDAHDYSLIDKYEWKLQDKTLFQKVGSYIFPFTLSFTSTNDKWVTPRVDDISHNAIYVNLLLVILFAFGRRDKNFKRDIPYYISILLFGIFIFIPFTLIKK